MSPEGGDSSSGDDSDRSPSIEENTYDNDIANLSKTMMGV